MLQDVHLEGFAGAPTIYQPSRALVHTGHTGSHLGMHAHARMYALCTHIHTLAPTHVQMNTCICTHMHLYVHLYNTLTHLHSHKPSLTLTLLHVWAQWHTCSQVHRTHSTHTRGFSWMHSPAWTHTHCTHSGILAHMQSYVYITPTCMRSHTNTCKYAHLYTYAHICTCTGPLTHMWWHSQELIRIQVHLCSGKTSCAHLLPYKPSSFLLWTLSFSCLPYPTCPLYLVSLW